MSGCAPRWPSGDAGGGRADRPRPLQGHQRHARSRRGRSRARGLAPSGCGSVVRAGDVVGRMGGEEFVLILPGADAEAAEDCAERARAAIAELTVRGRPLARFGRCGRGAGRRPRGRRAARERRRRAVLGQALRPRAGPCATCAARSARRPSSATRSRRCSSAATSAIETVFQPVVELATGRAGGFEALTRIAIRAAPRAGRVVRAGAPGRPRRRARGARHARRAGGARPPRRHLPGVERLAARAAVRAGAGRAARRT